MARILLASELGANLGHLMQLLPLADALRERGHEAVFALGSLAGAHDVLHKRGFEYHQAPPGRPARMRGSAWSYSEILEQYGYRARDVLGPMLAGWRELYRRIAPDVVLSEYAPTALLASRGLDVVRIVYGVGFCCPPREEPLPGFRTWDEIPQARLTASDARVLDGINAALAAEALPELASMRELFVVDETFLSTFPELDHYGVRVGGDYCGAIFAREEGVEPVWADGTGKRICVYLRPAMPAFEPVAEALRDSAYNVLWIAPGLSDETAQRYATDTLRFVREPVRVSRAAAEADGAVLYGGHGTVAALLLAGVPMALFPTHVEQVLVSRNVVRLGAGRIVVGNPGVSEAREVLDSVFNDRRFADGAKAFAARYRQFDPAKAVARIAQRIEAHCARRTRAVRSGG